MTILNIFYDLIVSNEAHRRVINVQREKYLFHLDSKLCNSVLDSTWQNTNVVEWN